MLIKQARRPKNYLLGLFIVLMALLGGYGLLLTQKPNARVAISPNSDSILLTVDNPSPFEVEYTLFGLPKTKSRTQVENSSSSNLLVKHSTAQRNYPASLSTTSFPRSLVVALTYPWAFRADAAQAQYVTFLLDSVKLPVVSLNAPSHYFFGKEGLYSIKKESDKEVEHSVHFQFLDAEGNIQASERAKVTVAGYSTKKLPLKSLNFGFDKPVPASTFFSDSEYNLQSLRLRSAGNDFLLAYMRDAVVSALGQSTHCITLNYQPVVVFINGEFWGLQYLREKIDEKNIQMKYPKLNSSQILLGELHKGKSLVISNGFDYQMGKLMSFIQQADLTQPSVYDSLAHWMNLPNFIDYVAVQTFVSNSDWPHNNVKCVFLDNQLHFLLYDTDFAFAYPQHYQAQVGNYFDWPEEIHDVHALTHDYFDSLDTRLPSQVGQIYQALMQVPTFREQFSKRYRYLLQNSLSQVSIRKTVNELSRQLSPLMPQHIARWGYPLSVENWQQNVQQIVDFCARRRSLVIDQLRSLDDQGQNNLVQLPHRNR